MVKAGELKYVLVSGDGMGGPGGSSTSELSTWAVQHGTAVTDAGVSNGTLYEVSA